MKEINYKSYESAKEFLRKKKIFSPGAYQLLKNKKKYGLPPYPAKFYKEFVENGGWKDFLSDKVELITSNAKDALNEVEEKIETLTEDNKKEKTMKNLKGKINCIGSKVKETVEHVDFNQLKTDKHLQKKVAVGLIVLGLVGLVLHHVLLKRK